MRTRAAEHPEILAGTARTVLPGRGTKTSALLWAFFPSSMTDLIKNVFLVQMLFSEKILQQGSG